MKSCQNAAATREPPNCLTRPIPPRINYPGKLQMIEQVKRTNKRKVPLLHLLTSFHHALLKTKHIANKVVQPKALAGVV